MTATTVARRTLEPDAIRNPAIRQRLARLVASRDAANRAQLLGQIRADFSLYLTKDPTLCPRCLRPTGAPVEENDSPQAPLYRCSSCGQVWVV